MLVSEFRKLSSYIFGGAAAIITNVSLIVGLGSAGAGKGLIIGALLTIAIADNITDSLGIHLHEEAEGGEERLSLFAATLSFVSRLLVSLSFIAIVLVFSIRQAIPAAIVWGLLLLTLISYLITRSRKEPSVLEILKHLLVAVAAIALSRYAGSLIAQHFQ